MASFDIECKIDPQMIDNVVNVVKREIGNRYDFRDSKTEIEYDKKANLIHVTTSNEMQINAIDDEFIRRAVKQKVDASSFDFTNKPFPSGAFLKKDIKLKSGIDKENSKKIMKIIKDSGAKVQASIMDEMIRVQGKKIDDLQEVIAALRAAPVELPLTFANMKS
jgi:uncharacterized protein YajQ (UPF0234 family)